MYQSIKFTRRIIPATETNFALTVPPPQWWITGSSVDAYFAQSLYFGASSVSEIVSCSRASIAYSQTAAGVLTQFGNDVLRITDLGLLMEGTKTNMLSRSQEFDTAGVWDTMTGTTTVTPNTAAAPDTTVTADTVARSVNSAPSIRQGGGGGVLDMSATTYYTFSVYVKVASGSGWIWLMISDFSYTNRFGSYFNCSGAGTVGSSEVLGDGSVTAKSIEVLDNGWYRCVVTGQFTSAHSGGFANFTTSAVGDLNANWDGSGSMYLWGAQVEQSLIASSYIPTAATSAARADDVANWIGPLASAAGGSARTFLVDVKRESPVYYSGQYWIHGTGAFDYVGESYGLDDESKVSSNNPTLALYATIGNGLTSLTGLKCGYTSDGSGRSLVAGGGTVATDGSTGDDWAAGGFSGSRPCFAYIRRLTAWNSRLSDTILRGLTAP